ncbi:MAG: DEAD/DEAH box helicase [Granulosicoccus sp.]|nr:DEAD/DEAH box helicase [Granulosicoccus sp.]
MSAPADLAFSQLDLSKPVLKALENVGYETPSPIQARTIPLLLKGRDVLGQAQTGTGKTAAFALPILSNLDLSVKDPQTLVLAPTRELAIQVAEAFKTYAAGLKKFNVLPIYGGQDYRGQLRALQRGVHVVVGTPGRVMDHMRRGTLKLDQLTTLVLDEADEMLRMGFIDDVEWILEQSPDDRQIALFSATMPTQIRRIADKHLREPEHVTIKEKTTTASTIKQRYWPVSGRNKLDTLTRILEAEPFEAMIVFVRTKQATAEIAEKLEARGYAAAALNGDIAQNQRERTVNQLKAGKLDILVATDVAARGLDVERISHVINYDVPHDTESYVHRIGRTGRAGREGDAILFIAPREKRLLHTIEKATKQKIEQMSLPSNDLINQRRIARFKDRITDTLQSEDLALFSKLIEEYQSEQDVELIKVAAALAQLLQGDAPFLLDKKQALAPEPDRDSRSDSRSRDRDRERKPRERRERGERKEQRSSRKDSGDLGKGVEKGFERFRIEVGHDHEVRPGNIVGAIANEADLDSEHIGRINIFDEYSTVDLPEGMPKVIFKKLKTVWVSGRQLKIARYAADQARGGAGRKKPAYAKEEPKIQKQSPKAKDKGAKKKPRKPKKPAK